MLKHGSRLGGGAAFVSCSRQISSIMPFIRYISILDSPLLHKEEYKFALKFAFKYIILKPSEVLCIYFVHKNLLFRQNIFNIFMQLNCMYYVKCL